MTKVVLLSAVALCLVGLYVYDWDDCNGEYGELYPTVCEAWSDFKETPTEETATDLLDVWSDGESAYFHMAVLMREFDFHPKLFARALHDDHRWYFILNYGAGAFEYFPQLKQENWGKGYNVLLKAQKAKR